MDMNPTFTRSLTHAPEHTITGSMGQKYWSGTSFNLQVDGTGDWAGEYGSYGAEFRGRTKRGVELWNTGAHSTRRFQGKGIGGFAYAELINEINNRGNPFIITPSIALGGSTSKDARRLWNSKKFHKIVESLGLSVVPLNFDHNFIGSDMPADKVRAHAITNIDPKLAKDMLRNPKDLPNRYDATTLLAHERRVKTEALNKVIQSKRTTTRIRNDAEHIYQNILFNRFPMLKDVLRYSPGMPAVSMGDASAYDTEASSLILNRTKHMGSHTDHYFKSLPPDQFEKMYKWDPSVPKTRANFRRHELFHEAAHVHDWNPSGNFDIDVLGHAGKDSAYEGLTSKVHSAHASRDAAIERRAEKLRQAARNNRGFFNKILGRSPVEERISNWESKMYDKSMDYTAKRYRNIEHEVFADSFASRTLKGNRPLAHLTAMEKQIGMVTGAKHMPTYESGWYHGTTRVFNEFSPERSGYHGLIFATKDTDFANRYAQSSLDIFGPAKSGIVDMPNVRPLKIDTSKAFNPTSYENADKLVQHVFKKNDQGALDAIFGGFTFNSSTNIDALKDTARGNIMGANWDIFEHKTIISSLKELGHTAVLMKENGAQNIAVIDPTIIKSVFEDVAHTTSVARRSPEMVAAHVTAGSVSSGVKKTSNMASNGARTIEKAFHAFRK